MATRLELQARLEEFLGSRNVYYQPPETIKLEYPCIVYSKQKMESRFANDAVYSLLNCYQIIVIGRKPDNPVIDKILRLPYSSYDRYYPADNLNHDVITLFY